MSDMTTGGLTLINGQPEDRIPADDRGFLYGDHVFETIAMSQCIAPLWSWHWVRLNQGCLALGIDCPPEAALLDDLKRVAKDEAQVVRITVTRGSSTGGYWLPTHAQSRRIVQSRPWPQTIVKDRRNGLRVATAQGMLSSGPHSDLVGLKHGSRLSQVLLAKEAQQIEVDELLVYRQDGSLAEGVASNVIVVLGDRLYTPDHPDVMGVGLDWLKANEVEVMSKTLRACDLDGASEILMVNAVAGVRPVATLDGHRLGARAHCHRLQAIWSRAMP